MRFLHTADWHLGRIFYNTHLTDDQAHVLGQLVALVKDSRPDAVVIAGDVFDRAVPPPEAVSLLDDVLAELLLDCQVPVVVIAGNHDSPERLGFGERLLARQKLYLAGQVSPRWQPVVLEDAWGPVYFCPLPYAEPAVVRDKLAVDAAGHEQAMAALLAAGAASIPAGRRRVAVAHAFVAGGQASESERPLAIGGIPTVPAGLFGDFCYAALGHLHQAQQVGSETVRYAGSLLKYSFAEASHRKSVSLVEIDGTGGVKIEPVALRPRRDVRCLQGELADILARAAQDDNTDDYIMAILTDSGAVLDAMGKLRRVYPNIMHIEKARFAAAGETEGLRTDHRRQTSGDLFAAFFGQVTGQPLADGERAALANLLDEFGRREREAGA